MNNIRGIDFDQLKTSIKWSNKQLETPRKKRLEVIKQYVGKHYADDGSDFVVPTNFLELAVTIYSRLLASRAPKVMFTANNLALRPFAKSTEIALNQIPEEIGLGATLNSAVKDALFFMGIVKVGLCSSGQSVLGCDYGEPFVDIIDADDYFFDMSAKSRKDIQFEGNTYWIPVEDANRMFGEDSDVKPDDHTIIGEHGESRAEGISKDTGADLYKEKIWLCDVWLSRERQMLTYGVKTGLLYRVIDWDGPEEGPYHVLTFNDVPGNMLPLPPVSLWRDMHDLANSIFRKLGKQAVDKKTVAVFSGSGEEMIKDLKAARDGDGIKGGGGKVDAITLGGIDSPTLAFYLQLKDCFNYFAGNLDTLGGLAPSSDTVGQEKLLNEGASSRLQAMTDNTKIFVKGIFKSLAWYEWTDPIRERIVEKNVKGTDIGVQVKWSAETRKGDFLDYNFDIDVYSMQEETPASKVQKLGMILERFVTPYLPIIQSQGGAINFEELLSMVGEYSNMPELETIVEFNNSADNQGDNPVKGNPIPAGMPNHTTRTYKRVNESGKTRSGNDNTMATLLMGGKAQQADINKLG